MNPMHQYHGKFVHHVTSADAGVPVQGETQLIYPLRQTLSELNAAQRDTKVVDMTPHITERTMTIMTHVRLSKKGAAASSVLKFHGCRRAEVRIGMTEGLGTLMTMTMMHGT